MNFIPIIVMGIILLVITVLLAVCDRLLVTYGECSITVTREDEKKQIQVRGGNYLLANLNDNGFNISSSCGGKATCGYCKVKVLSGGGLILPTEEIFMSREEKLDNMRLACQVKVKNNIEIYIPNFLTTVKNIVKNRTYDPRLRWSFSIARQIDTISEESKVDKEFEDEERMKILNIIQEYRNSESALMLILQSVNAKYNYFPENVLWYVSQELKIPLSQVLRIATFYNAFSLKLKGKHIINVCMGTACYVKGGEKLLNKFRELLGINAEETTEDKLFTLKCVRCIGCCGLAPAVSVGDETYGKLALKDVPLIIEKYKKMDKGVGHA